MRADRLLSILMMLQSRGRMTAMELARELEVSERTIYRDVMALGSSGVPIVTEQGPGGGISLIERYRSDLTGLNEEEVQALFMLSIPAPLNDLGLDRRLKDALYKLSAALPATLRDREQKVRQRIHIDSDGWDSPSDAAPHLLLLQKAVWGNSLLDVKFGSAIGSRAGVLSAIVEPYGLVSKAGEWYLIAYQVDHMSVLRIDRILHVHAGTDVFERDNDFDLVEFWQLWCEENQAGRPYFEAVVEVSEALRPYLPTLFGDAATLVEKEKTATNLEGRSTWQLKFGSFDEGRGRILALGAAVKVIEPVSLRLSVEDYARQIVKLYLH